MSDEDLKKTLADIQAQQKALQKTLSALNERIDEITRDLEVRGEAPLPAPIIEKPPLFPTPPAQSKKPIFTENAVEKLMGSTPPVMASPPPLPPAAPPKVSSNHVPPESPKESFEVRVGQVWLIRLAVLLFLTGLVFLGNDIYNKFILELTPLSKALGLYLISGALIGIGFWLEKKRESLRNFSQVVLGGGFAAVYYTTYASHFVGALRWIESVTVVAILLLGWAGIMIWVAERKKSQTLATLGLLLAYYTCVINPISWFTLLSNLVLGLAAVTLLVRNRWTFCSWVALLATYGAFAYWQLEWRNLINWEWPLAVNDFTLGTIFLASYWILFTVGLFWVDREKWQGEGRAAFLTLNNLIFYGLLVSSMPKALHGNVWWLTEIFGAVLLGLGFLAARFKHATFMVQAYVIKGMIFLTAGLFLKFSGFSLALLVLLWSVILLLSARDFLPILFRVAAAGTAGLAVLSSFWLLTEKAPNHAWMGAGMGLILLFEGWWERKRFSFSTFHFPAFYYVGLAVLCWILVILANLNFLWAIAWLTILAVLVTIIAPRVRFPELAVVGGLFLLVGQIYWLERSMLSSAIPWWNTTVVLSATLFLSYWWQYQNWIRLSQSLLKAGAWLATLFFTLILYVALELVWEDKDWLIYGGWLALAMLIYGGIARQWTFAISGQFFLFLSVIHFFAELSDKPVTWFMALVPFAAILLLSEIFDYLPSNRFVDSQILQQISGLYHVLAMVMLGFWIHTYLSSVYQAAAFGVVGLSYALFNLRPFNSFNYQLGRGLMLWGLFLFLFREQTKVQWLDLIAIISPAILYQISKKREIDGVWLKNSWIVLPVFSLWIFVSRWIGQNFEGLFLTGSWSLLGIAIFGLGLIFKERWYRLSGLLILALAVGRIVVVDLWQFGTLSRVVTLLSCGAVLGILGFIYNRYGETIKKYL